MPHTESKDAAEIAKLTKDDVLGFMDDYIMPSAPQRAKLSVHMRSQRISADGKEALLAAYGAAGLEPSADLKTLLGSSPTLDDLAAFVAKDLAGQQVASDKTEVVLRAVEAIRRPPAAREGVKLIDDVEAFRASLEVGPTSRPVEECVGPRRR
jgi:hypothetical protein